MLRLNYFNLFELISKKLVDWDGTRRAHFESSMTKTQKTQLIISIYPNICKLHYP